MIKTLSPYSTTAKTAEIMSRYRPIAPKPEGDAVSASHNSPYLWPHLQARPTRTRKRGRSAMSPPIKRTRTTAPNFQLQPTPTPALVTLPLLSPVPDLNKTADQVSEERCLVTQGDCSGVVIAPQPLRPVGSTITVGCINEDDIPSAGAKTAKEVEEEVDSEILPAVVSDWNNRVRVVNSAYKEMVGQPECRWLDTMVGGGGGGGKQRICGEVRLSARVPVWAKGFSCWVRIEWAEGKSKMMKSVSAFCDVTRLDCESKDYLFTWRFHTRPHHTQYY